MLNSGELAQETMTVLGMLCEHSLKIVLGMAVWKDAQGMLNGGGNPHRSGCVYPPVTLGGSGRFGAIFNTNKRCIYYVLL